MTLQHIELTNEKDHICKNGVIMLYPKGNKNEMTKNWTAEKLNSSNDKYTAGTNLPSW